MSARTVIYRHSLPTRILHWMNALCVFVVLMSGLQIFNAHPRLYWGRFGANYDPALMQIDSSQTANGRLTGDLRIGSVALATTGVLGVSKDENGDLTERAFPAWATIPSWQDLADGRRWHFFFAWLLVANSVVYLLVSFLRRHIQRELWLTRTEVAPAHIARDLWHHLKLQFPRGDAARHYNSLQKLSYLTVIFIFGPLMLATGLTMSPGMDAAAPWLLQLLGGRQSARTLHFVTAMLIALFIVVHLAMVLLAGPLNELRSMITGRYALPRDSTR